MKFCSYYFATERLFICIPLGLLEGVYFTTFRIFELRTFRTYRVLKAGGTCSYMPDSSGNFLPETDEKLEKT